MKWTIILLAVVCEWCSAEGMCVMSGPCAESEYGDGLNCVDKRLARPLPEAEKSFAPVLQKLCPHLMTKGANSEVCCKGLQIDAMEKNFNLPEIFLGRCPACFENFKKIFCDMTCSPDQDNFAVIKKTSPNPENQTQLLVDQLAYYMSKSYADALFDSCKGVEGIVPGAFAIELMCGAWGKDCTSERFYEFLGTGKDDGGASPFSIKFTLTSEASVEDQDADSKTVVPLVGQAFKCTEQAGPSKTACACVDCKEAC